MSRRAILGALLGGGALWWWALKGQRSPIIRDAEGNVYLRTAGGNVVGVTQDEAGRILLVAPNGDLYYDTGDVRTGVYIVDRDGEMYNAFIDGEGNPQKVRVGNVADLKEVEIDAFGGVPIDEMKTRVGKVGGRKLTVFEEPSDVYMPPDALPNITEDGNILPPSVLEEGAMVGKLKKQSWWPFGGPKLEDQEMEPFKRGIE